MPIFWGLHYDFHHFRKATISIVLKSFNTGFVLILFLWGLISPSFCRASYIGIRGFVNNFLYSVLPFLFSRLVIFATEHLLINCYKFSFHSNFCGLKLQCFKCNRFSYKDLKRLKLTWLTRKNSAYPKCKNVDNANSKK